MIWKNIKNYEGLYQVSDDGQVKSLKNNKSKKEKILKPSKTRGGYLRVVLCKEGKTKAYLVHRLVADAFISNPDNLPQINHKDENKTNNIVSNLEYCTSKYNINFGSRTKKAVKKTTGVLNTKSSKIVKQFDLQGNLIEEYPSISEVERKFGYSQGNISSVCSGRHKTAYNFRWEFA